MSVPSVPFNLNDKQQTAVVQYVKNCVESMASLWNIRDQLLIRDKLYYREVDQTVEQTRAMAANLSGDVKKYQNLTVPIVMPQVESALAYHAGVFLSGYPIFGIAASPQNIDAALQMETVIADNSIQYSWTREMIMFLRDALKYNLGAIEVAWRKKKIYTVVSDATKDLKRGTQNEIMYEGNSLRRLDPYNLVVDKRVLPSRLHCDGEFGGFTEIMSRIQLKQLMLDLSANSTMNGRKALESKINASGSPTLNFNGSDSWYYLPQVNPNAFLQTNIGMTTNWLAWAMLEDGDRNKEIMYNDLYEVTTLYGRIIPHDFRLAVTARNQPQIWKFVVVNRSVLLYVERMTNAHNYLPILLCQPIEDGLGYQTKSFADNAVPFQFMSSALWNAAIASKRRLVFDRLLYDSSRVRKDDIDKVAEVARIPVKSSAYGKPVGEAVHAFPYRDDGVENVLAMATNIYQMADEANGQNKVQRGMFQKGNKTKTEFVETMGNANSRQQLQALGIEFQTMVPLKEILKLNMLQYQGSAEYYNIASKQAVKIEPVQLRQQSLTFKVSDGILPTDKLLSTDLLQVFMQTVQTSPLMQAEFDIVGAFVYWCKTQGAQWLEDFRRTPNERNDVLSQLVGFEKAQKAGRPQNQETGTMQ